MNNIIYITIGVIVIYNIWARYNLHIANKMMKNALAIELNDQHPKYIHIIKRLVENDTPMKSYVLRNSAFFLYPFASNLLSGIGSLMQIFCIIIFLVCIYSANWAVLVISIILFFVSGNSGARFNIKGSFDLNSIYLQNEFPPLTAEFFKTAIIEFHDRYQEELS